MTVYRVAGDLDYQRLHPSPVDPRNGDGRWIFFDCQPQKDRWNPPELYVHEPLKPRGDFMTLGGSDPIVVRDHAYQKVHYIFDPCAEMLPIDFEGERMWVVNVLECYNALDRNKTIWRGEPGKSSIKKHAFYSYRLTEMPLFKVPETMRIQTLLAHGAVHEAYDLKNVCEEHGLTGLKFERLWSDEE